MQTLLLAALALAASNWLVYSFSVTPGQISGNGFHPVQLLMTVLSMGIAVVLLAVAFGYAERRGERLGRGSLWIAGPALLAGGALLLAWAWLRFHEYEAVLPYYRGGGDNWGVFNQYTVRFWAADWSFWAGLLSLSAGGGLLRHRVPGGLLAGALALAFMLPAALVPSGYRMNSRGELIMLRPTVSMFFVRPGDERPSFYLVQHNNSQLLAVSAKDPGSGCTVTFDRGEQRFTDPCKGADYDRAGLPLDPAPGGALERYPVRIEGERLYIDVAHPLQPGAVGQ